MENYFYRELNKNTVEAVNRGAAFFMNPQDSNIPLINNSYTGLPVTGANYYHLKLSNDLNGKNHKEYVKVNEALSSNIEWLSTLPHEKRPRGTIYQEESAESNSGYSFVMPTAELNQNIYRNNRNTDNRAAPVHNYVPFQTSSATMDDFDGFIHEQFTNAINASLTGCPFRNNIRPHEMEQFKTRLVNEISRNPAFMATAANRARDEALDFHYLPFDRDRFIERARDETSPEFMRLNSAITGHINDMCHNRKSSFNPEFNELSRPLVINVENLYLGNSNPQPAVENEISGFVKKMIRQDKTAAILADTFAGTFIEKAIKLVRTGKRIFAGVMLAGALCNHGDEGIADSIIESRYRTIPGQFSQRNKVIVDNHVFQGEELKRILNFDNAPFSLNGNGKPGIRDYEMAHRAERTILKMNPAINRDEYQRDMTYRQVINFYQGAARKMGGVDITHSRLDDSINVADRIMAAQELKGDRSLKTCRDQNNSRSFYACLNQTIRDDPHILDQAITRVNNNDHHRTQSATRGQAIRR